MDSFRGDTQILGVVKALLQRVTPIRVEWSTWWWELGVRAGRGPEVMLEFQGACEDGGRVAKGMAQIAVL